MKDSNLPVSEVRQFLHSKPSCTKFTLATRKFKRMKAFAKIRIENCCMDLTNDDKLAKDNNVVKYLLVRQQLFDRTVDAKRMKTKCSTKTFREVLTMNTRKDLPKKFRSTRKHNLLECVKNFAMLKEYKFTLQ